ncbi:hypothetical protein OUZ56_009782 [Daphnia magna]|uniref:Uncharacterized protein n=1 Tax=Daphnia magna TaxID=35525 RepID=A0ABR0AGU9_9CRUS|nr:hypothetical protein OUZ56_009782 [Daphnia magna]
MQWNQVSYGRKPIEVDAATCRRMRDSRQCRGKAKDITGPNSFALEGHPFMETSWLRTATEKMTNCRLEEVTLQSECPNSTITSPLDDIPGAINGSFKHNLVTLIWDDSWKEAKPCELRVIEKGMGVNSVCGGGNLTTYHPVLGMDRVVVAVREVAKGTDLVEIRPHNAGAVTKMTLSELTRAEITSHTQYIRDFAMDISNHLARKGGQAAWIPDPDEEDILYCTDYSSTMEEFGYVAAFPDDEEDLLNCADNPDDDEVMYDADA